jgi:hypothetical protein
VRMSWTTLPFATTCIAAMPIGQLNQTALSDPLLYSIASDRHRLQPEGSTPGHCGRTVGRHSDCLLAGSHSSVRSERSPSARCSTVQMKIAWLPM